MEPERWLRIEKLYHAALECDAEQRAAFLAEACPDVALRSDVEVLLAANEQASGSRITPALELEAKNVAAENPAPTLAVRVGQELSHYRILSRIGSGGMGEVFLARDTILERRVALKLLPLQFTQNTERLQRFVREARAASGLNHPNIITIYEIGEVSTALGETHFIATEFIEGATLRTLKVDPEKRMRQALNIAVQVASALDAAHKAGIVHRDIKPENVMVRPDGLVKVLDFGLAKLTSRPVDSLDTEAKTLDEVIKTRPGIILGTLRYMSPEQARGRSLDPRSDIFSLGVVLYELLTGQALFAGETDADVVAAIIHKESPPLSHHLGEVPAELERVVQKALAKDAEHRYQNARDLQIDLQTLMQESELSARLGYAVKGPSRASVETTATPTSHPSSVPGSRSFFLAGRLLSRSPYWRYLIVLLMAAALIGGVWWLLVGSRGESEFYSPATLRQVQLVSWKSEPGESHSDGTFSRDGRMIAFSSIRGGKRHISITQVSGGEPVQVTKNESDNQNPIWSPDSQQIAFVSRHRKETGIWRIQAFGGTPSSIAILGNFTPQLKYWSKDGATIYYRLDANLFALDVASGQRTQVTHFEPDHFLNADMVFGPDFSISPDEERIAYLDAKEGQQDVWVMPIRGGPSVRVTMDAAEDRHPVWCPDGKRIIYSSNRDGTFQICVAYLNGRQPQQITFGDVDSFVSDVSTDGKKILYGALKEESDICGVLPGTGEELQITSDVGCELWPDISPDGKSIAFQEARDLGQGNKIKDCAIMTRSISGDSRQIRLAGSGMDPRWSPDGRTLAFLRFSKDAWNIWTVRPTGGEERQISNHNVHIYGFTGIPLNRAQTRYYDWSPDGGKIIYVSKEAEEFTIRTVSYDGSSETKISATNSEVFVFCPLWSPDGSRIAYVSNGTDNEAQGTPAGAKTIWKVWVREMVTGKAEIIYQADSILMLLGWFRPASGLLLATAEGRTMAPAATSVSLIGLSVTGADKTSIAHFASTYLYNTHLSPDGRTIAFVSRQDGRDNVWLIPATGGEAKKTTQNTDPRLYYSSLTWSPDGRAIYFGKQSRGSLISMIDNFK